MEKYNFNEHILQLLPNRFRGSERKKTVVLDDNKIYLLKLPDPTREIKRTISYINNSLSEYIGCKIAKSMGLPVQNVVLGEYTATDSSGQLRTYVACACENIAPKGYFLVEAETLGLSDDNCTESAKFETIPFAASYVKDIGENDLQQFYARQFVLDTLIGNRDRHNGNWGILSSKTGNAIAPIYDCGSSLLPLLDDHELSKAAVLTDVSNGKSAILDANGQRINYRDYLLEGKNEFVNEALLELVPKIKINEVCQIIEDIPYISEQRKQFYKDYVTAKFEQVLIPALTNTLTRGTKLPIVNLAKEDIHKNYVATIKPIANIPIGERRSVEMGERELVAYRASSKNTILIDSLSGKAEAVISTRSKNKESLLSLQILSKLYDIDLIHTAELPTDSLDEHDEDFDFDLE